MWFGDFGVYGAHYFAKILVLTFLQEHPRTWTFQVNGVMAQNLCGNCSRPVIIYIYISGSRRQERCDTPRNSRSPLLQAAASGREEAAGVGNPKP